MKHYLITTKPIELEKVFLQQPSEHEISLFRDLSAVSQLSDIDGIVFILTEVIENFPFQKIRERFQQNKVILLSNELQDKDLKNLQYQEEAFDLYFRYPVDFTTVFKMYEMLSIQRLTELRGVEQKYQKPELQESNEVEPAQVAGDEISRLLTADMWDEEIGPKKEPIALDDDAPTMQMQTPVSGSSIDESKRDLPIEQNRAHIENYTVEDISVKDVLHSKDEKIFKLLGLNQSLKEKIKEDELKISHLEQEIRQSKNLVERASNLYEESKIELELLKRRSEKDRKSFSDKEHLLIEKVRLLEDKLEQLKSLSEVQKNQEKFDYKRIQARENELEEKLSLLQVDSAMQLQNREHKIIELRRRIDLMEFDLNNALSREENLKGKVKKLERCLEKVSDSLGGVIHLIDDDPIDEVILPERKKA